MIISGGGKTRAFEIDGATVGLANLVISQGSAAVGGGILESSGSLSLSDVRFKGNVAYGSTRQIAQGGAIEVQTGDLTINRSNFTGNRVTGNPDSPVVYPPFSIFQHGFPLEPVVFDSVSPSLEVVPAPLDYGGEADGGAIAAQGGTLLILNSDFSGNTAIGSPVQTEQTGGDAYGGAVYTANASLTSLKTTFEGNQAIGGDFVASAPSSQSFVLAGGDALGGAIASNSAAVTLQNDKVRRNLASGGNATSPPGTTGGQGGAAQGAGIALLNNSTGSLVGGTISGNEALGGTGASPSVPQPFEFPASGSASGGGISAGGDSSVSSTKTTFTKDVAKGGNSPTPFTSNSFARAEDAWGGAIDFGGTGNLVLTQANLVGNLAIGGSAQAPGQAFGGGVAISSADSVSIFDSTLKGNLAETGHLDLSRYHRALTRTR